MAVLTLALSACSAQLDEQEQASAQASQRAAAAAQPAPVATEISAGACDESQAQWAIGKAITKAEVEQARQDAGAQSVRSLKPDQAATMDFNDKRLNLDLDAKGVVTAVRCG